MREGVITFLIFILFLSMATPNHAETMSLKKVKDVYFDGINIDHGTSNRLNSPSIVNDKLVSSAITDFSPPSSLSAALEALIFDVYDISDPLNPERISTLTSAVLTSSDYISVYSPYLSDGTRFFFISEIIDFDGPSAKYLNIAETMSNSSSVYEMELSFVNGSIEDMFYYDNQLFIEVDGNNWDGIPSYIYVIDVEDSSNPQLTQSILFQEDPEAYTLYSKFIGIVDSKLLVISGVFHSGTFFELLDLSDYSFTIQSTLDDMYVSSYPVVHFGDYAIGAKSNFITLYDISNVNNIVHEKIIDFDGNLQNMNVADDMLFITTDADTMVVGSSLNILDSLNSTKDTINTAAIKLSDTLYIHYAGNNEDLEILEYSDRVPPSENSFSSSGDMSSNDKSALTSSLMVIPILLLVSVKSYKRKTGNKLK